MTKLVGRVTHYYNRIGVAVVDLLGEIKIGDHVMLLGSSTDFTQEVRSMQIEHQGIQSAGAGTEIALQVLKPVHMGDRIYLVEDLSQ